MARVFKSLYPDPPKVPLVNYYDFLFARPEVASWPDYTLYIDGINGRKYNFRSTIARIEAGATALANLGVTPNEARPVGILSENGIDYPVIVFALLKLTVPFVLFPAFGTAHEITALVKLSRISHLFVSPSLLPLVLAAAKAAGVPQNKIYLIHGKVLGRKSFGDLITAVKLDAEHVPTHPVKEDTLAYLVFSSGTSGLPKAVMVSHRNLAASALQPVIMAAEIERVYKPPPLKTKEGLPVSIVSGPLYHAMGLHIWILRFFLIPQTAIIIPKWNLNLVLSIISKYQVTNLNLVPAMVHQLTNSKRFNTMDVSGLVSVGSGAAYLPDDLRTKFTRWMTIAWFMEGYGLSECSVAAIFMPFPGTLNGQASRVPGMTGILLPGMEAKILREDGTDADVGEPGELYLRGDNVGLGYWDNEKASKETFLPEGWLRTGDRFRADKQGRFFYIDRVKDTLKISGVQVAPSEIEVILLEHPENLIVDVAVAGVQGARIADERVPRAWIVLSDTGRKKGEGAVVQELDAWVKEHLSRPKWLRGGIAIVNEIPKSPTGKVLRRVLVERDRTKL